MSIEAITGLARKAAQDEEAYAAARVIRDATTAAKAYYSKADPTVLKSFNTVADTFTETADALLAMFAQAKLGTKGAVTEARWQAYRDAVEGWYGTFGAALSKFDKAPGYMILLQRLAEALAVDFARIQATGKSSLVGNTKSTGVFFTAGPPVADPVQKKTNLLVLGVAGAAVAGLLLLALD